MPNFTDSSAATRACPQAGFSCARCAHASFILTQKRFFVMFSRSFLTSSNAVEQGSRRCPKGSSYCGSLRDILEMSTPFEPTIPKALLALAESIRPARFDDLVWSNNSNELKWHNLQLSTSAVVRQIVVRHIKRISFSLAEVLRVGIAC
jgi:hypothetical protein